MQHVLVQNIQRNESMLVHTGMRATISPVNICHHRLLRIMFSYDENF